MNELIPTFGDGKVAQPPSAHDIIYERIPTEQLHALYRKINLLKGILIAIQEFCYAQRREQIADGKADEEPTVQSSPILAVIRENLKD